MGTWRDYVLTFGTEFAVLAAGLVVFKLAAVAWGTRGFGEYVLARRTISMLQLPLALGMAVAVTRYVSIAVRGGSRLAPQTYFASGLLLVGTTLVASVALINAFGTPLAFLLFGDARYASLVRALSVALAGVVLHGVTYGELRGRVAMTAANALQGANLGLVPMAVFVLPGLSVPEVVGLTGALWCVIAGVACAILLARAPMSVWAPRTLWEAGRELFTYGAPRVPGEFALGALFTLPATVAAHLSGIAMAGFVGLAMSFLSMVGSLFAPIGQILLPAAAQMQVSGEVHAIGRDARRVLAVALSLTLLIVVILETFAPLILRIYLGPGFEPAVPVIRLVGIAAFPHVTYVILRNILDAVHVRPYNAKNLVIAVAVFVVIALVAKSAEAVPLAVTLGVCVLGVLTVTDTVRVLRRAADWGAARLALENDASVGSGGSPGRVG